MNEQTNKQKEQTDTGQPGARQMGGAGGRGGGRGVKRREWAVPGGVRSTARAVGSVTPEEPCPVPGGDETCREHILSYANV